MATLDTVPTRYPLVSESTPAPSISSSTTLRDDTEHDLRPANTPKAKTVKVTMQPRRKPRGPAKERKVKLGYQKVLRDMIIEPIMSSATLPTANNILPTTEDPATIKSMSWQQSLQSISMQKPTTSPNKKNLLGFHLHDPGVKAILETLMAEFGRGTHSSFMDDSYSVYLHEEERAAICFKVIRKVTVVYGEPLCAKDRMAHIFEAFRKFCKKQRMHVAVVGAGPTLAAHAKEGHWKIMEFAVEQVLNPATNAVIDETAGKTITRTNRKLVGSGIKLFLYEPRRGADPKLEQELMHVYESWRENRKQRNAPQAYSAVINPFALPGVTRYMFTRGSDGKPDSLAGLIRLGANEGYLLEPCIQLPTAPKGVTGFLVTHAMGLLKDENVKYMTFGVEALPELGEISRMPSLITDASRRIYRITFEALGLLGRKVFHESFYPEKDQQVPLYLLFPPGLPHVNVYQAVLDATHISAREVWSRSQAARSARRKQSKMTKSQKLEKIIDAPKTEGDGQGR